MGISTSLTTANTVVTVNGRQITDWGLSETPINEEPIDQKRTVRRGQGGNAVMLERINPGRRVTLQINPASADAAYLHGLYESGAIITYTRTQVGSLENSIGTEGVIVTESPVGRGGSSVTDDTFVMEFNAWQSIKGGD